MDVKQGKSRIRALVLFFFLSCSVLIPQDSSGAGGNGLETLRRDAKAGKPDRMVLLGLRYDFGQKGAPRDPARAVSWYRRAAVRGYAPAMMLLSERYEIGRGVPQDDQMALQWLRRSAHHGYPPAEDALGDRYASGQGVPKDDVRARAWYLRAGRKGYGESQDLLGEGYETGKGVPKNLAKAGYWYRRAARDAGNPDAFFRLGRFYEKGLGGVRQDPVRAYFWYSLAKRTSLSARSSWERIGKTLPEKDRVRVGKQVESFMKRYSGRWNRWILKP